MLLVATSMGAIYMASWWVAWATGEAWKRAGRRAGKRGADLPALTCSLPSDGCFQSSSEHRGAELLRSAAWAGSGSPSRHPSGGRRGWKEGSGTHSWGGSPFPSPGAPAALPCGAPPSPAGFLEPLGQSLWISCHRWLEAQIFFVYKMLACSLLPQTGFQAFSFPQGLARLVWGF